MIKPRGRSAVPPVERRGPASGEETKAQIRDAARKVFAKHGYFATTTKMIAAEAGVSTAALHHFFGRKHDLVLAVWRAAMDEEFARQYVAVDAQDTFVGKVHALLDAVQQAIRRDPVGSTFTALMREEARRAPELGEILQDTRSADIVRNVVQCGVDTGELDPDLAAAARGAIAAVAFGARMLAHDQPPRSVDAIVDGSKRLFARRLNGPPIT